VIDQWLAAEPRLLATRVHQDLVRDYGFEGSCNTVRRYVERARPGPPWRAEERFETAPASCIVLQSNRPLLRRVR
jgi:hypothetical protein